MHSIEKLDSAVIPPYTRVLDVEPIPQFQLPDHGLLAEVIYRYIHDDMLLDGNSRLNLATFVTTWMEGGRRHDARRCDDVEVLRVVIRERFTQDMAQQFLHDLAEAVTRLTQSPPMVPARPGFRHT